LLVNLENLEKSNVWSSQDSPFVCPFKVLPSHLRSGFSKIILQAGLKLLFLLITNDIVDLVATMEIGSGLGFRSFIVTFRPDSLLFHLRWRLLK